MGRTICASEYQEKEGQVISACAYRTEIRGFSISYPKEKARYKGQSASRGATQQNKDALSSERKCERLIGRQ